MEQKGVDNPIDLPFIPNSRFLISKANNRFFVEVCQENETSESIARGCNDQNRRLKPKLKHNNMNSVNESPPTVDVLIITAADGEQEALLECKDWPDEPEGYWKSKEDPHGLSYWTRSFHCEDGTVFTVATTRALKMGALSATAAAYRLVSLMKPRCLAMVGICAGRRGYVKLGDVLAAERVVQLKSGLERLSYVDDQPPSKEIHEDIITYNLHSVWQDKIRNYQRNLSDWTKTIGLEKPKSYEYQKHWLLHRIYEHQKKGNLHPANLPNRKKECAEYGKVIQWLWNEGLLVKDDVKLTLTAQGEAQVEYDLALENKIEESEEPDVKLCPIGTVGQVQEDERLFEYIERLLRTARGVEMEGYAIGAAAWELGIERMIVVKAVSDYGDQHREKDRHFRKYACKASASFLIAFLKKYLFI